MCKYNGYKNYETWLVNLWIDNDQSESAYWISEARYYNGDAYELSEALKEHYECLVPEEPNVMTDLLRSAISEVDFYEIAEHLIDYYKEQEEEDSELWAA